jgi:hypothetical protein
MADFAGINPDDALVRITRAKNAPLDHELGERPASIAANQNGQTFRFLAKDEFIGGFIAPDYLIDGILQRRFMYSLTAPTAHGKTAVAQLIAKQVGSPEPNLFLGTHSVDKGTVAYFAGENPDDLRMRIIADDAYSVRDGSRDRISFVPGIFNITQLYAVLKAEAERLGGIDLVIVDTSAAFFLGNDELSNTQMGNHARMLRTLATLPGGPCVLILCHPIKHVTEPSQLLPRGGGAFLAEMDGNLTLWKLDETLIELWHNKIRGPGFEPLTLRLEKIKTEKLADKKGRLIPTVRAVPISQSEEESEAHYARSDEDRLLVAMLESGRSVAKLAIACGWTLQTGDPHKSKVHRVMTRLHKSRLVTNHRSTLCLFGQLAEHKEKRMIRLANDQGAMGP